MDIKERKAKRKSTTHRRKFVSDSRRLLRRGVAPDDTVIVLLCGIGLGRCHPWRSDLTPPHLTRVSGTVRVYPFIIAATTIQHNTISGKNTQIPQYYGSSVYI